MLTLVETFRGDLLPKVRTYVPGLIVAFTIAAASRFISEHYGAPVMLFALLIGIAFNFLSQDSNAAAGIDLASKPLLKVGIALLGARLTFDQLAALGLAPILIVISLIVLTISSGIFLSRFFSRSVQFGLLTGGAVAICGASAALALSAVLTKSEEMTRDTLFTVVAVTALSTFAMIIYPILFVSLGFSDSEIGILIGATIHDVAQVIGAGFAVSDETGEIATYVKLLRVSLLPVVILAFAFLMRRQNDTTAPSAIPWFAVGFIVILGFNSLHLIPASIVEFMNWLSQWLLIAAIAALGVKTSLRELFSLGPSHIGLVVAETLILLTLAVAAVYFFVS